MKYVALPCGGIARVANNVSPETLSALNEMMRAVIANGGEPRVTTPHVEYQEGDIEKFFGVDPDFTGDMTTEEYIDSIR